MAKKRNPYKPGLKSRLRAFGHFLNTPFRRLKNRRLCNRYPFLLWSNEFGNDIVTSWSDYDTTFLDCMPKAWRKDFGLKMCEEIRNELIRCSTPDINWLEEYSLCQVKEKFGTLRWYDNGSPKNSTIEDIISKYEDRSGMICIDCGKPAKYSTYGWITYLCEECYMKQLEGLNLSEEQKAKFRARDKLYSDNIPYRVIYNKDGTKTRIDSPYLEEMKKLWPDERPKKSEEGNGKQ